MAKITSAGDLEVATLVEHQLVFPDILNLDLYAVLGEPPDQNILFHQEHCMDLFVIRVAELFAEGDNVEIDGRKIKLSLFGAAKRFRDQHLSEAQESGLVDAISKLDDGMGLEVDFEFWCSELDTQFKIKMTRQKMIAFAGNLTKHNLLRINTVLDSLQKHLGRNGYKVKDTDVLSVLEPFKEAYSGRLNYHASFLVEMLYDYFWAFNTIVWGRFRENGSTNDHRNMTFPAGTTDVYRDLYGSLLVFQRYSELNFSDRRPVTTKYLKLRY